MTLNLIFSAVSAAVFLFALKKEKKAKVILNGIAGLISLIIFNNIFSVGIGYSVFSVSMAVILGVPAVGAMVLVKLL